MTKPKHTGLAGFGIQNGNSAGSAAPAVEGMPSEPLSIDANPKTELVNQPTARKRAKGEMVALTLRVNREQWRRLHELAVVEGLSLNQLALQGLTELFVRRGQKPL